ncbi:beta strand repeat-containing protein [Singulisphaera rosea]
MATTRYVSNGASNGYSLGSDSNNGTSKSTPVLTITHALAISAAGDSIYINPTATPYAENGGSNYLNMNVAVTITTDPGLVLSVGKAIIQPATTTATRVVNNGINGVSLQYVILDALSAAGITNVANIQGATGSYIGIDVKNFANATGIFNATGSNGNMVIDKCSATAANGNSGKFLDISASQSGGAYVVSGCNVDGIASVFNPNNASTTWNSLTFQNSADGTPNTFNNMTSYAFNLPVGITPGAIYMYGNQFTGVSSGNNASFFIASGTTISGGTAPFVIVGNNFAASAANPSLQFNNTVGGATITGNTFANPLSYGIALAGNTTGNNFSYNTFANGGTAGFYLVSGCVSNNDFVTYNNFAGIKSTSAFRMEGSANNLTIANNTFGYTSSYNLWLNSSVGFNGVVIRDNTFNGVGTNVVMNVVSIFVSNLGTGLLVTGNRYQGPMGLIFVSDARQTDVTVSGNKVMQYNANPAVYADPIRIYAGGQTVAQNNTVYSDAPLVHGIIIGCDGFQSNVSNATSTSTQNFGDVSGNNYIAQPFIFSSGSNNDPILGGISVPFNKVGTPAGTINCSIYSDNAGVPGTLIANGTSNLAPIGSTAVNGQNFLFTFFNRPTLVYNTTYWIVLHYTGNNDGSNYLTIPTNTSATNGAKSANGTAWTALSASALFNVMVGNFSNVNPIMSGNTCISTNLNAPQFHGCFLAAVTGGQMYSNFIMGGGPLLIAKEVDGQVTPCNIYSNISVSTKGLQQSARDKGSRNVNFVNNTFVVYKAPAQCFLADSDFYANTVNKVPSQNVNVQNNIFLFGMGANNTSPLLQLGSGVNTCLSPTLTNNDYYVYSLAGASAPTLVSDFRGVSATNYTSLSSWQVASGLDVGSVNADPQLPGEVTGFTTDIAVYAPIFLNNVTAGLGASLTSIAPNDYLGVGYSTPVVMGALNPIRPQRLQ